MQVWLHTKNNACHLSAFAGSFLHSMASVRKHVFEICLFFLMFKDKGWYAVVCVWLCALLSLVP